MGSRCPFMTLRRKASPRSRRVSCSDRNRRSFPALSTARYRYIHSAYLYVGLVHSPGSADGASEPFPALLEFRRGMLHPPQNCRVGHAYAPCAHHSDQVSITELKAQIPADAQNHDLPIEVSTFEQVLDRYESRHPSIIAECERVCTRADAFRKTENGRLSASHNTAGRPRS